VWRISPGREGRLGIDYASLKKINKGIVLASISGFGQDGPIATAGFDKSGRAWAG